MPTSRFGRNLVVLGVTAASLLCCVGGCLTINDLEGIAPGRPVGGISCAVGETTACYTGPAATENVGECEAGTRRCSGDAWEPCLGEVTPTEESCDGLDNDCDGIADENIGETSCGEGLCKVTVSSCVGGKPGQCIPLPGSAVEACDGVDDNCDGFIDEGCNCLSGSSQSCYSGASSTKDVGQCKSGMQTCAAGDWGPCSGEALPKKEVCDKADNDCDGKVDEGGVCCTPSCASRDACGSDGCDGSCGSCDSDRVCHKGFCVWTHGHNGDTSVSCSTICAWGKSQCVDATTGGCGTKGQKGTCYCW